MTYGGAISGKPYLPFGKIDRNQALASLYRQARPVSWHCAAILRLSSWTDCREGVSPVIHPKIVAASCGEPRASSMASLIKTRREICNDVSGDRARFSRSVRRGSILSRTRLRALCRRSQTSVSTSPLRPTTATSGSDSIRTTFHAGMGAASPPPFETATATRCQQRSAKSRSGEKAPFQFRCSGRCSAPIATQSHSRSTHLRNKLTLTPSAILRSPPIVGPGDRASPRGIASGIPRHAGATPHIVKR